MKYILMLTGILFLSFISVAGEVKTLILQPGPQDGFDAYINSAYPDDPGWDKGLLVTAWTLGGYPYIGKALLKFDLSQLAPDDSILDARLNLYFDELGSWTEHSGDNQAHIFRITDNWNFMTVTWNTQPSFTQSGKIFLPASISPQQDYTDIDVTAFAQIWKSNADENFGMIISLDTEEPYANLVFAPSDWLNPLVRPKLVITYTSCTSTPVANFSFSNQEKAVTFFDQSSSASSWLWDFGDGYQSTLQNPSHVYAEYGKYLVCLAIQDSCGRDTICDTISLCYDLNPYYYYSIDTLTVSFHDSSNMPLTWWWDFGDGFFSDLKDPVHTFQKTGTYFVCETVTNNCSTEIYCDSINLKISGFDEYFAEGAISIYPNPTTEFLTVIIRNQLTGKIKLAVFDVLGRIKSEVVYEMKSGTNKFLLDLQNLVPGVYFLQIKYEDKAKILPFNIL